LEDFEPKFFPESLPKLGAEVPNNEAKKLAQTNISLVKT
jgi:hypothetical protein